MLWQCVIDENILGIKNTNSMNGGLPPTSLQQLNSPETFDVPNAKYNIPAEFLQETNRKTSKVFQKM